MSSAFSARVESPFLLIPRAPSDPFVNWLCYWRGGIKYRARSPPPLVNFSLRRPIVLPVSSSSVLRVRCLLALPCPPWGSRPRSGGSPFAPAPRAPLPLGALFFSGFLRCSWRAPYYRKCHYIFNKVSVCKDNFSNIKWIPTNRGGVTPHTILRVEKLKKW